MSAPDTDLLRTPLYDLHLELGARMVPFAGYSLPVQYKGGLIAEHQHTREAASLFDVSHMGQVSLVGPGAASALESLIPMDVQSLGVGKQRYGLFLNDEAGVLDDFMFVNTGEDLFLIVNGACKVADIAHLQAKIGTRCEVRPLPQLALLALQGPKAVDALQRLAPGVQDLVFMTGDRVFWQPAGGERVELYVTRSGYTGEDGFEISVHEQHAEAFARALLAQPEVKPAGLGARNSLRLEAGLCLYGNDLTTATTPAEAGLGWAIQKVRRTGGDRAGGFPGADKLLPQLAGESPLPLVRVGLIATERVPVREPAELQTVDGLAIGQVTSGLLAPTLNLPIAMGYVPPEHAALGTVLHAVVRGRAVPMTVSATPFMPAKYHRPAAKK